MEEAVKAYNFGMARAKASYAVCKLCGYRGTKASMTKHLTRCVESQPIPGKGKPVRLLHLRIEDAYQPSPFWMDIEIKAGASLGVLDDFLRVIWLECCGHLSQFRIDGVDYEAMIDPRWGLNESKSMGVALGKVVQVGSRFAYKYDYGTTSELRLGVLGERNGYLQKDLRLLARNEPPEWQCSVCGQPATRIDTECAYDMDNPFFCDAHTQQHAEQRHGGEDYMFLPVVNSPRVGMCGYEGPADESPYVG